MPFLAKSTVALILLIQPQLMLALLKIPEITLFIHVKESIQTYTSRFSHKRQARYARKAIEKIADPCPLLNLFQAFQHAIRTDKSSRFPGLSFSHSHSKFGKDKAIHTGRNGRGWITARHVLFAAK
ncbi:hypothetical protein Neut_1927 [Nitrosomonas eutropha C91]|uniref:Uncharacterized protein n=1 Tax=Nitrosomonas eutropha (strain DSM 101675 / C91 / Nm57) TaxID=335283 RepID=Q0AES3_NITEC|nr:hypothetical protein Neut_1927 [Nitrosomonas eutropha C91]MXS80844.1 hypothetical protein [Nitrosomonas sp. GH22]